MKKVILVGIILLAVMLQIHSAKGESTVAQKTKVLMAKTEEIKTLCQCGERNDLANTSPCVEGADDLFVEAKYLFIAVDTEDPNPTRMIERRPYKLGLTDAQRKLFWLAYDHADQSDNQGQIKEEACSAISNRVVPALNALSSKFKIRNMTR